MGAPTVLVCGHVTLDRVAGGLVAGGSAFYAARAHAALGARVRVVTAAADDFPREALSGVEVALAPSPRTTVFANAYGPGGRRAQRVESAAPPLSPASLPPGWADADLLHLAPVLGEVDLGAWRAAVRAGYVGVGVQGWVRGVEPGGRVVQPPWRFASRDLAGVDAACVGEDDLLGQEDLVSRLAAAVPIVAFTRGRRGCDLVVRGRRAHVGVHPAREVDPTGAGDVFSAGFFLALAGGADPVDAGRLGAAAASIVVEGRGGETLGRVGVARARAAAVPARGPSRRR